MEDGASSSGPMMFGVTAAAGLVALLVVAALLFYFLYYRPRHASSLFDGDYKKFYEMTDPPTVSVSSMNYKVMPSARPQTSPGGFKRV